MIDWTELSDVGLRFVIAILIGGLIGFERELHGRWAGLRTHILVTLGAAIFAVVGMRIADGSTPEVTRVVQGIAAGIGFLGAGTILKLSSEVEVKGLTTAASIWLCAALGTAIGLKMYEIALSGSIASLVVLFLLRPLDKWFDRTDQ